MPDLKLGVYGSEVTLPPLTALGGPVPDVPVVIDNRVEEAVMSDGSTRFGMRPGKRRWSYSWGFLTEAQFQILRGLNDLQQTLHFQDGFEGTAWYYVAMLGFTSYQLQSISTDTEKFYSASFSLKEA